MHRTDFMPRLEAEEKSGVISREGRLGLFWARQFARLGSFIARDLKTSWLVLLSVVALLAALCSGIPLTKSESRLYKLWVATGTALLDQKAIYDSQFNDLTRAEAVAFQSDFKNGESAATQETLLFQEEWLGLLYEITADVSQIAPGVFANDQLHLTDICDEPPAPVDFISELYAQQLLIQLAANFSGSALTAEVARQSLIFKTNLEASFRFPCTMNRVLDCFAEGGFDFLYPQQGTTEYDVLQQFGVLNPFLTKPSIRNLTDAQIEEILRQDACTNFANIQIPLTVARYLEPNGLISSWLSGFFVYSPLGVSLKIKQLYGAEVSEGAALKLILKWEAAFLERFATIRDQVPGVQYFAARSPDDAIIDAALSDLHLIFVSYVLVIIYVMSSELNLDNFVYSRTIAAGVGVFLEALSVAATFGVIGFFQIPLNPTGVEVLPYVALGLGVDDLFLMLSCVKAESVEQKDKSVQEIISNGLSRAGSSVTLTSLTNFVVCLLCGVTPLPAVSSFAFQAAVSMAVSYFMVVTAFTAVLAIDLHRIRAGRLDVAFWITSSTTSEKSTPAASGTHYASEIFNRFAKNVWAPAITKKYAKIDVLCVTIALFLWLILRGVNEASMGMNLAAVTPTGAYTHDYINLQFSKYSTLPADMVFPEFDHRHNQKGIYKAHLALSNSPWLLIDVDTQSWYSNFISNINIVHVTFIAEGRAGDMMPVSDLPANAQLILSNTSVPLVDRYTWLGLTPNDDPSYTVPPDYFDSYLRTYLDTVGAYYSPNIIWKNDENGVARVYSSKVQFLLTGMVTTKDYTASIRNTRKLLDQATAEVQKETTTAEQNAMDFSGKFRVFPYGTTYLLWEQYLDLTNTLFLVCGLSILGVFIVTFAFMLSALMSLLLIFCLIFVQVCVFGLMTYAQVQFNSVSLLCLVLVAGISVDYTVQFALAFHRSTGTRDERAQQAVQAMFSPVLSGGLTTLLSVVLLAAAKYPYFEIYFLRMFGLMAVIGLFAGLALLPVLLSLVGPRSLFHSPAPDTEVGHADVELKETEQARPDEPPSAS
eukprot:TRINITY_DN1075_c0_g1_i1.p1 TRINITY_DN1075_c0_g1~~TRINITY_DN1075_c0_g1_i1.p1  ORF type:complete len:1056 (+),score=262.95 TRINITY_DN1075_c0_g1_i1:29-3169(+)